jgi:hypothetical protein
MQYRFRQVEALKGRNISSDGWHAVAAGIMGYTHRC